MFSKFYLKLALFALMFTVAAPAFSQVAAAARQGGIPISVGGGFNYWDMDWGTTRMEGGTVWVDYYPTVLPAFLQGLGAEIEARDVSLNPGFGEKNMRQVTVGGGPIYSWRHFHNIHPYGKFDMAFGGMNFTIPQLPLYRHDTRTVYGPGGGVEYRIYHHIWARVDYEYQFWPELFGPHSLNPRGFTFGAMYDFRYRSRP
jgi:Outer membrane protein beta-barrel domain